MNDAPPLSENDLAKRWGITTRTLRKWRADGLDPKWIVIGKNTIRYRMIDVLAYEEANLQQKPTSEGKDHE